MNSSQKTLELRSRSDSGLRNGLVFLNEVPWRNPNKVDVIGQAVTDSNVLLGTRVMLRRV